MENGYHLYLTQDKREYFSLPAGWTPLYFIETDEATPRSSIAQMTLEALSGPRGTPPFQDLLRRAQRIAVIVDDLTRPTPTAEILEVLLSRLVDNGFSQEKITIIVALGTHGSLKKEGLEIKLGRAVLSRYKVVQHNAWQADLVPIRIPDDGGVVRINPAVAQADVRVGISSVLPHSNAGYGGGPKIIMPGVCDFESIRDHHMKNMVYRRSAAGITKGNPFHEDLLKVARAVGLDFSINCVYNQKGQVIRITAGSLEMAFAEAVGISFEKLGSRFEEKVDVTITSSYPYTHGQQVFKGMNVANMVTKNTGAILLAAPIVAPLSPEFLNSFHVVKEKSHNNPEGYIREALSKGKPILPDKPIDFNMAISSAFLRAKIRTILVSPLISREEAQMMGFEYASSMEDGLRGLGKTYPDANVAIFPAGGLIIPITAWEQLPDDSQGGTFKWGIQRGQQS
jgi:nickel-dependent lactate racemase